MLVITEQDFRYALISAQIVPSRGITEMIFGDIGWIDVSRIHGDDLVMTHHTGTAAQAGDILPGDVGTPKRSSRFVFAIPSFLFV